MTLEEISNRLDTLLDGNKINEYEKSLYLTQAQNIFVSTVLKNYEYSDEMRHMLGPMLIEQTAIPTLVSGNQFQVTLDDNIKSIVYEKIDTYTTIPLDWNDIHYTLKNPFREPNESIAYRVTLGKKAFLYALTASNYYYVYCKIPNPIILQDLPDGLEIQGISTATECELNDDSTLSVIDAAFNLIVKNKALFAPKPAVNPQQPQQQA